MKWLFKEEPTHFPYDELVENGRTDWAGVKNPVAQKHLRAVAKGDSIFYYHTGKEKAVVGVAKADSQPYPDSGDPNGKRVVVDIVPVRKLQRPVTLAEIKASGRFATFDLTRLPRLSVMPVTDAQWAEIERMAKSDP